MSEKKILNIQETFVLALQNHKKKNFKVAEKLYLRILKTNQRYVNAYSNLGILYIQLEDYKKSVNCYEKVIQIQPNNAAAHNNLGFILNQIEKHQKAKNCLEKAIQIEPSYADAYYNLGNALKGLKNYKKAIIFYEKAIAINPNYVAAFNSLGVLFNQLREYKKSVNCYEKAIQIQPNYATSYNNLGNINKEVGEHQKAISFYEKAIQLNPNYIDAYNNLGNTFKELGDHQKAINCYEKVIKIEPDNLTSHWLSMNTFPIIYRDLNEIEYYRKRFENCIKKINKLLEKQSTYTKKQLINAINSSTNFYLHYQGKNDLELQKSYANLIENITKKIFKEFHVKRKKNIKSGHIKIGFISSFFRKHTVSKLFKNWVLKLDKKYFEKFVYYVGDKFDSVTNEIKQNVDNFVNNIDINQIIPQISDDNLDVLIYLEIGMSTKIQILSSLRLAPMQCNTWGHPMTSGSKNIDYFITGKLMESENSQKYYLEKLITLPGLGIDYDFPHVSKIKKPNISNKSNLTIFLNLQSLFKLLPQDDHIYLDIIKKKPNSCFWFLHGMKKSVTLIFIKRISKLFQNEGYDFEKYFYFHPRCNREEFFGIIEESDIILDSFNWSGGNTHLEAISLDKPIVTCASDFMRGRHTSGILKILDIEETIATSKKDYVDIAIKLAEDSNFRNNIIKKIKKNKNKLYNNFNSIICLQDIIKDLYFSN
jgi:protein O-GlcNAc transferase